MSVEFYTAQWGVFAVMVWLHEVTEHDDLLTEEWQWRSFVLEWQWRSYLSKNVSASSVMVGFHEVSLDGDLQLTEGLWRRDR